VAFINVGSGGVPGFGHGLDDGVQVGVLEVETGFAAPPMPATTANSIWILCVWKTADVFKRGCYFST